MKTINKREKMKHETILKKIKLVSELMTLAYESDDANSVIEGLLNSSLQFVPSKVLNEWKKQYLKNKENA